MIKQKDQDILNFRLSLLARTDNIIPPYHYAHDPANDEYCKKCDGHHNPMHGCDKEVNKKLLKWIKEHYE